MDDLFEKFEQILDDDLKWFGIIKVGSRQPKSIEIKRKHKDFVKYLVSVATHPIGLRASAMPYNTSPEDMLAYIMDMYKLSNAKIRKMVLVDEDGKTKNANIEPTSGASQYATARKRHSWRPELRFQLIAPTFLNKQASFLDNLSVRVYMFKDERENFATSTNLKNKNQDSDQIDIKSKGVLNKIFRRFRLKQSKLIRPVNEMRCLLKSELTKTSQRSIYNMVPVMDNGNSVERDIYMRIRRYYCEPNTNHVLRFEFWLDNLYRKHGLLNRYRRYVRHLVYDGHLTCCLSRKRSTYMNENQEFYGYINIDMTQLPSYPTRFNCPISSLQDRLLNNCDILLDLKNRRMYQTDTDQRKDKGLGWHLINHLRIYANSIIYQCTNLDHLYNDSMSMRETFQNISIENLMFLPAYSLINQHRLQSNISQLEDQSLKRISFLLLLMRIYKTNSLIRKKRRECLMVVLISLLQNEYMVAHRTIDSRTLQELNPFQDSDSVIMNFEIATIERFIKSFLSVRLKDWLGDTEKNSLPQNVDFYVTLNSLRMVKSALSNLLKCIKLKRLAKELENDLLKLKNLINQLLCKVILQDIGKSIENIANHGEKLRGREKGGSPSAPINSGSNNRHQDYLWTRLLNKINRNNHNLRLYWLRSGLDGLLMREVAFVSKLRIFHKLEERYFRESLLDKIDNYLI